MHVPCLPLVLLVRLALPVVSLRTAADGVEIFDSSIFSSVTDMHDSTATHRLVRARHRLRHRPQHSGLIPHEAELRCYCNLPACITTGYMCQSMKSTCFSERVERGGRSHTRHGCLELLSRHKQHICERLHSENKADLRLRCCTEDMCNIADAVDVDIEITSGRTDSFRPALTPPPELVSRGRHSSPPGGSTGGELWLRAATIAVPIAGLAILCVLVLLAVRMLRRETKLTQYQYAKAPLCSPQCEPHDAGYHPPHAVAVRPPALLVPTPTFVNGYLKPSRGEACTSADVHRARDRAADVHRVADLHRAAAGGGRDWTDTRPVDSADVTQPVYSGGSMSDRHLSHAAV